MDFEHIIQINEELKNLSVESAVPKKIKVDTFHLPYIEFLDTFELPGISLNGPEYEQALKFTRIIKEKAPGFVSNTNLLPQARPQRDLQQLHFVREIQAGNKKYLYILKIFTLYMGGAESKDITIKAVQGLSASFISNRIYYQARIVPVDNVTRKQGQIIDFESTRIKDTLFEVSSSDMKRDMWSTVLFDEVDFSELNQKFVDCFSFDSDWKLGKIFSPLVVDYLSLCINPVYPILPIIEAVAPHFHEGFSSFIKDREAMSVPEKTEYFWSAYFAKFTRKLSPAKSGNPHWEILTYPDEAWLGAL